MRMLRQLKVCFLIIGVMLTSAPYAQAEDPVIDIDAIRNEMQAARKSSLQGGDERGAPPSLGNARMKNNEDALLNEIQNDADSAPAIDETITNVAEVEIEPDSSRESFSGIPRNAPLPQRQEKNDLHGAELELSYIKLKNAHKALSGKLQDIERERDTALSTIKAQQNEMARIKKENADVRRRLLLAETEIERLAHEAQSKSEKRIKETMNVDISDSSSRNSPSSSEPSREVVKPQSSAEDTATKTSSDVAIATVLVDKIYLRSGPGKENSPVMTVAKGVRLTVETRRGDWLRVVTPNNGRAWVSAEVVQLN
jgi:hypothetical protein